MNHCEAECMPQRTLRILTAEDVRRALPMHEAVEVMKQAFRQVSLGEAVLPARVHLAAPQQHGVALIMPAYLPADELMGLKVVTLFDQNPQRGRPRIQAVVLVLDGTDGRPLAVIDGTSLTALRTGAASGAATQLLANPDASVAAVFGAGVQGRTQLEAVLCVRPIREVRVWDPDTEAAERFCVEMSRNSGLPVRRAATATAVVQDADIICAATTARTPVFRDCDLKPGVHINAIGSYQPEVQEIPAETVRRARLVVDHRASAWAEAGDLLIPLRAGLISEDHTHAELGEIVAGLKPGRTSPREVTLFKSVGVAAQDLAAAARVLQHAQEHRLGTEVSL